jgi:hypothetical protein
MSEWQNQRTERNKQSLARLSKRLPTIFPPTVLVRALSRPFIPPNTATGPSIHIGAHIQFVRIDWRARWRSAAERPAAGPGG